LPELKGKAAGWVAGSAAVSEAVAAEVGEVAALCPGSYTKRLRRRLRTHQKPIVLVGTVARRSSRTNRIPCGIQAHNLDERTV
jgi:hypothetical protein